MSGENLFWFLLGMWLTAIIVNTIWVIALIKYRK
jgi:hypothetical protein